MTRDPWRDLAACVGRDPRIFHPTTHAEAEQALAVGKTCPVTAHCADAAIATRADEGVWGGILLHPVGRRRPSTTRTECKRGHDLTLPGAVYARKGGRDECAECARFRYLARKAAAMEVAS